MLQPQNQAKKYQHLFTGIDTGKIRIPQFQRDFVWSKVQTARLIDSIIKGFPIGTFILWQTSESMRTVRAIGNAELPDMGSGDTVQYVLDGQQRITSLYAVQKGLVYSRDGKEIDYKDICINLDMDPDSDEQIVYIEPPADGSAFISVHDLLVGDLTSLVKAYPDSNHLERIDIFRKRLTGYDFSTILMDSYPIDIACEVFTRINTGGTDLTLFEIMVAKTYDVERDFDLSKKYQLLIDNNGAPEKDLEDANFDTVPASTVLQCIAAHLVSMVRRRDILKLDKFEFIEAWPVVKQGIFSAVDYVRLHLRIPVSQLLPYNALLVPLSYFFIRNNGNPPSSRQDKLLQQYFWWASLTYRFSSGAEGKLGADFKRMEDILKEKDPDYQGEDFRLKIEDIQWKWFSAGDAFCKAILCLLAFQDPKSFQNNSLVKIDNSYLRRANSKNYHHFFPKSYLQKQGIENWKANSIVNITIVDDYLNKRKIRAKSPSAYMKEFSDQNDKIEETMKSHLIGDFYEYGIWEDDYEKFIEKRSKKILVELLRRLQPFSPFVRTRWSEKI